METVAQKRVRLLSEAVQLVAQAASVRCVESADPNVNHAERCASRALRDAEESTAAALNLAIRHMEAWDESIRSRLAWKEVQNRA